jgi:hypothetical protein
MTTTPRIVDCRSMELPEKVMCEKCGNVAQVLTRQADERALAGHLPPGDHRWQDGFFFNIDCPNCGVRSQSLAPPP